MEKMQGTYEKTYNLSVITSGCFLQVKYSDIMIKILFFI